MNRKVPVKWTAPWQRSAFMACYESRGDVGEMVGNYGNELNQLFDILADWNAYLERYCPDVYSTDISEPEL
ncbi:hypothetical protein QSV34_02490 [Porticoccus sp. W117]|uniref:hypothetical protein n=1 Tax=Porticoccus sp. W117 TaxID=3054777 RepID=UPI002592B0A1|nr:hypothetical protein [Porticoccus sp. W117]MDM3870219.1 hypothetical protein [Porticoccus sp. W117]